MIEHVLLVEIFIFSLLKSSVNKILDYTDPIFILHMKKITHNSTTIDLTILFIAPGNFSIILQEGH